MAQRRMFSLKVIDTDLFLDMPLSTQALYFHLSIRADDDGFIGNHKKIMRMIGASDDDMKILIAKQLIIPFDTGVCVVKHWRVHNYIQKDRYNPTFYKAEKAKIVATNNVYEKIDYMDTKCIHDVNKEYTQVRLGKVRLGKDSIELEKEIDIEEEKNSVVSCFNYINQVEIALTPKHKEELIKFMEDGIDEKLILKAVDIAVGNGKRLYSYIKGILNKWIELDIKTIEQLELYENNYKNKKSEKGAEYKKTGFHNFDETFTQYSEEELDTIIMKGQKDKYGTGA